MSDTQWQSALSAPMTPTQRKALLKQLQQASTLDSLRRPELLMDFFTDNLSFTPPNLSLAIPSLSGLFHLITKRNLSYPLFYTRLYLLLTPSLLHSKHRSKFLRHLDIFLSPTNHVPVTAIASFIKKLSRLSLFAPPAAIIAIIPFTYNLLKSHPTCTFMLHRHPYPPYTPSTTNLGEDPYNPDEQDPQKSKAIDSSLWELDTLRNHYNPTVAQIAGIMAEQFTKAQYQLEDFLDHGYVTMLESELKKDGKKEPVVEWRIPGKVFGKERDEEREDVLLDGWSFN